MNVSHYECHKEVSYVRLHLTNRVELRNRSFDEKREYLGPLIEFSE